MPLLQKQKQYMVEVEEVRNTLWVHLLPLTRVSEVVNQSAEFFVSMLFGCFFFSAPELCQATRFQLPNALQLHCRMEPDPDMYPVVTRWSKGDDYVRYPEKLLRFTARLFIASRFFYSVNGLISQGWGWIFILTFFSLPA